LTISKLGEKTVRVDWAVGVIIAPAKLYFTYISVPEL
jgi:hypothetical protein